MSDTTSDATMETGRRSLAPLIITGVVGAVLAATALLWTYLGTAVFFEMMRAGFVACFG